MHAVGTTSLLRVVIQVAGMGLNLQVAATANNPQAVTASSLHALRSRAATVSLSLAVANKVASRPWNIARLIRFLRCNSNNVHRSQVAYSSVGSSNNSSSADLVVLHRLRHAHQVVANRRNQVGGSSLSSSRVVTVSSPRAAALTAQRDSLQWPVKRRRRST